MFIWLPCTRNCSCRLATNHSCHVCLPSCHVRATAVAIQQRTSVVWAKSSSLIRAWTRWWLCGQKLVRLHSAAGNCVMWGRVGNLSNTHTPALSYVARENCLGVSRFMQTALDDDPCVWASCKTATRVGVIIWIFLLCFLHVANLTAASGIYRS